MKEGNIGSQLLNELKLINSVPFIDNNAYTRESCNENPNGQSGNDNPNGQSGICGLFPKKEYGAMDYLRTLYEAKKALQEQHEIQLLNDVKRLKKFKGYRRKIVQVDIKKWMDKTDKEIVETVKNLL